MDDSCNTTEVRIAALRGYARSLEARLGSTIGADGSWPSVRREHYQSRTLRRYDPYRAADWQRPFDNTHSESPFAEPSKSFEEVCLSWRWQADGRNDPLVILAPAGSGKTAFLEDRTLNYLYGLLGVDHPDYRIDERIVPVFLSLAKNQGPSLEDAIYREAAAHGLPAALTRWLIEHKQLVVFLDGFDEVPAERSRLTREICRLRASLVVGSRPGYGAEALAAATGLCWALEPLNETQVRELALRVRGSRPDHAAQRSLPDDLHTASRTPLLSRPLFLLAWCETMPARRGSGRSPSMEALCRHLFDELLLRHGLFAELRRDDPHQTDRFAEVTERFAFWVGRLGIYLARHGFRGIRLEDDEGRAILAAGAGTERFAHAAMTAGLLYKAGSAYQLPKVPLVEHCMARLLVADALAHPDAPRELVGRFREWIWRPALHDTLDHVLDALWHSGNAAVARWAQLLIDWALDTGALDPRRGGPPPHAQDDLGSPFALSCARWMSLRPDAPRASPEGKTATESVARVAEAVVPAIAWMRRGVGIERCFDRLAASPLLPQIVEALVGRALGGDAEETAGWEQAIFAAAQRLHPGTAPEMVLHAVRAYADSAESRRGAWVSAAWGAASAIAPEDAESLLQSWLARFVPATDDPMGAEVLHYVARRIPPVDAGRLLHEYLRSAGVDAGVWHVIAGLAVRLRSSEAPAAVKALVPYARDPKHASHLVLNSLEAAASRVESEAASGLIDDWLTRLAPEGKFWLKAVEGAAGRVWSLKSVEVLQRLVSFKKRHRANAEAFSLGRAIARASATVSEADSVDIVHWLVAQLAGTAESVQFLEAVCAAASRVPAARAEALVMQWLERFHADPGREEWLWAALGAVARCDSEAAERVADHVLRVFRQGERHWPPRVREVLQVAVSRTHGRDALSVWHMLSAAGMRQVGLGGASNVELAFVSVPDPKTGGFVTEAMLREPSDDGTPGAILDPKLVAASRFPEVRAALRTPPSLSPTTRPESGLAVTKVQAAIGYLLEHPDKTDKEIAVAVGCAPSTLASNKKYRKAREVARAVAQERVRRDGTKFQGRTDRQIEEDEE